jgi:hypothetical protein
VLLAAAGATAALSSGDARRRPLVALCLWWIAVPVAFDVFVWEPIWNHYFVEILPPLAILSGLGLGALDRLPNRRRRALAGGLVAVVVVVAAALGLRTEGALLLDDRPFEAVGPPGSRWLTLDPTVNVMTGTEPACGVIDPFNVLGPSALAARAGGREARFHVTLDDLLACLEADPEAGVFVTSWTEWFLDQETLAELWRRHPGRVRFADPRAALAFERRGAAGPPRCLAAVTDRPGAAQPRPSVEASPSWRGQALRKGTSRFPAACVGQRIVRGRLDAATTHGSRPARAGMRLGRTLAALARARGCRLPAPAGP